MSLRSLFLNTGREGGERQRQGRAFEHEGKKPVRSEEFVLTYEHLIGPWLNWAKFFLLIFVGGFILLSVTGVIGSYLWEVKGDTEVLGNLLSKAYELFLVVAATLFIESLIRR